MNAPYRPTSQANLDHEIAQAIQSLRQQGLQNFAQDLEQVKQLSAALVSWNDALLQELDQAMSRYAQSRAQLLLRILTATPAVAASPEPPRTERPVRFITIPAVRLWRGHLGLSRQHPNRSLAGC